MPEVNSVVKLRLFPDEITAAKLDKQSRICNWLYNQLLDKADAFRREYQERQSKEVGKKLYTRFGLRNELPILKEENAFLKTVHSSLLKNVALRLTGSIQAYQKSRKGKRRGKETGWPSFRSWKARWFSLLYDEPTKGFKVKEGQLFLSLGRSKENTQRQLQIPMEGIEALQGKTIKNARIVKQANVYSVVFTVSHTVPDKKPIHRVIALDPNHKNFAYGVDTQGNSIEIASPYWLKRLDVRIDELKAKRDRCEKKSYLVDVLDGMGNPTGKQRWVSSRRWEKQNLTLMGVYEQRREQSKTWLYTLANRLYRDYDVVGIGDYTPRGGGISTPMRRAMNNRSLIGRFKEVSSWVALKSGKHFIEYSEKGTTRTCHICGEVVLAGLSPEIRNWTCSVCQTSHHRDENAAINGLGRVLGNLPEKSDAQALPVPSSGRIVKRCWAWCVRFSGVHATPREWNGGITSIKKLNREHGSSPSKVEYV